MNKKRISMIVSLIICSTLAILVLCSCGEKPISTVEELYSMKSNKSYKLVNDIDLENREWYPLAVKNFNGNNHTIKNCFMIDNCNYKNKYNTAEYAGFFTEVKSVSNVVFENVEINSTTSEEDSVYFGLVAGYASKIENVIVKDSRASLSGLSLEKPTAYHTVTKSYDIGGIVGSTVVMNNCKVISSNIEANINFDGKANISYGGLVGSCDDNNFENNHIISSTVNLKTNLNSKTNLSSSSSDWMNIGGICGQMLGKRNIKSCVNYDSKIEIIHNKTSDLVYVGGIIGKANCEIDNCCVSNSKFLMNSVEGYSLGGIAGYSDEISTTNCLSSNNVFEVTVNDKGEKSYARIGGISGIDKGKIKNCVSKSNTIKGDIEKTLKSTVAGLTAATPTVINSISWDNTLEGDFVDMLCPENSLIVDSYIVSTNEIVDNVNSVEVIRDLNVEKIMEKANLDRGLWGLDGIDLTLKILNGVIN